ncbi:MAG: GNAT family N-acetyltransferase [Clostridiales bacterium]|nr:GNAT family N-acetyltransferase [Clostridiales bacterium]
MKLIEPTLEYAGQIMDYRREFLEFGGSMDGCGPLRRMEDPKEWFAFVEATKREETTPPGLVPSTQFIYVRESDNRLVGMIQIRRRFNEYLEKYAGHIGYSVRPSERRKGYASAMLREVLPVCASLGIKNVLISCLSDNEASRRTILKNGGVYESTVYLAEKDVYLKRYWIDAEKASAGYPER